MTSTSPSSTLSALREQARDMTALHTAGQGEPLVPPVCAAQDPLHEILLRDVAARLPGAVRQRMLASQTTEQVDHWLVAGAIYSLVARHPQLSARYLELLSQGDPASPALVLAQTYGERLLVPERTMAWWKLDGLGTLLQLLGATGLLLLRAVLVVCATACSAAVTTSPHGGVLGAALAWPLLAGPLKHAWLTDVMLAVVTIWLGLEAVYGPRLMEFLRRQLFCAQQAPLPVGSRLDSLYVFWCLHAFGLSLAMLLRMGVHQVAAVADGVSLAEVPGIFCLVVALLVISAFSRRLGPALLTGTRAG